MPRGTAAGALTAAAVLLAVVAPLGQAPVTGGRLEILRATRALAPHIVGRFYEPLAYQQASTGQYFVFDRRAHTVFGIDEARASSWQIVQVGHEDGRVVQPSAFDAAADGTFVVADAPMGGERVQIFGPAGARLGGFTLPGRPAARVTIAGIVLNGVGSLQYTGRSIVMSQPETGSLITEYALSGRPTRSIGTLRATGHEHDRDLHVALNSGLPLVDPRGGFYFVFQTGVPLFRKYDADGRLVFERHVEGREIDDIVMHQPTRWPRRTGPRGEELPLVLPTVRAAAVDQDGALWISFVVPFTYVYDADGEKVRTVQFNGAGIIAPTSLSFGQNGRVLVTPGCFEFAVPPSTRRTRSPDSSS